MTLNAHDVVRVAENTVTEFDWKGTKATAVDVKIEATEIVENDEVLMTLTPVVEKDLTPVHVPFSTDSDPEKVKHHTDLFMTCLRNQVEA